MACGCGLWVDDGFMLVPSPTNHFRPTAITISLIRSTRYQQLNRWPLSMLSLVATSASPRHE
uniref:Uncharacterized protein n=1 Tax=Picea glauca TaxID=3330 RepID=A0A124GN45_PICGL|nr:hypothetical protein ABT39_MTgene5849 [Picea glauca]QHR92332.1 hypothetical protein Q903MT_gene6374 [Picea sitchensis]